MFIANHPSGFSKFKWSSKDSLSEQNFYSNKNIGICECKTALHPVAGSWFTPVQNFQSSKWGDRKPRQSTQCSLWHRAVKCHQHESQKGHRAQGTGNIKEWVSAPRRPILTHEAVHKQKIAQLFQSNLCNTYFCKKGTNHTWLASLQGFIWAGRIKLCECEKED